jgi:hypothetical protein
MYKLGLRKQKHKTNKNKHKQLKRRQFQTPKLETHKQGNSKTNKKRKKQVICKAIQIHAKQYKHKGNKPTQHSINPYTKRRFRVGENNTHDIRHKNFTSTCYECSWQIGKLQFITFFTICFYPRCHCIENGHRDQLFIYLLICGLFNGAICTSGSKGAPP